MALLTRQPVAGVIENVHHVSRVQQQEDGIILEGDAPIGLHDLDDLIESNLAPGELSQDVYFEYDRTMVTYIFRRTRLGTVPENYRLIEVTFAQPLAVFEGSVCCLSMLWEYGIVDAPLRGRYQVVFSVVSPVLKTVSFVIPARWYEQEHFYNSQGALLMDLVYEDLHGRMIDMLNLMQERQYDENLLTEDAVWELSKIELRITFPQGMEGGVKRKRGVDRDIRVVKRRRRD